MTGDEEVRGSDAGDVAGKADGRTENDAREKHRTGQHEYRRPAAEEVGRKSARRGDHVSHAQAREEEEEGEGEKKEGRRGRGRNMKGRERIIPLPLGEVR